MRRACRDAIAVFPVPDEFPRRTEWIAEEEIEVEAISGCTARGGLEVSIVLERNRQGREILWRCASCGQPFNLGWGDECNACITAERRHRELLAALVKPSEATERGSE